MGLGKLRNCQCPCGSGVKFKNCCLEDVEKGKLLDDNVKAWQAREEKAKRENGKREKV